ncbi:GNAT family N-acetyltransferase [Paenibacillus donghaensis]|uniref:GNAT family N-acetyltransferase n=2 Tax=Paenibacillus donghaensis TaxID=414771 RepID=A0A2Z2KZH7_9BACL|nr:GNAT family N-acetyltransferase [Paenibacillus donghaensis]
MKLDFATLEDWDEELWSRVEPLYLTAFPSGAKPVSILRSMVERKLACLHIGRSGGEYIAMAITGLGGKDPEQVLIIDYMAVREDHRGQGLGTLFLRQIREWAVHSFQLKALVIEVEAGNSPVHWERVHFWERCGFMLTAYIHQYIWVPEPYQAMLLPLEPDFMVKDEGQSLFKAINNFHKVSFRPQKHP